MKRLALLSALVLVATGCENSKSKLDGLQSAPKGAGAAEKAPPSVAPDHSGDVETRLRRLETNWARHAEALDFLGKVYAQQKAQQEQQKREEHDPNAVFAVDIAQNVKMGLAEGPAGAAVTIVEAWDFA